MKRLIILVLFFECTNHNVVAQNAGYTKKPNIILFLVDDMGWGDASQPFGDSITPLNKKYHTPNLERLAKEGMLFSDAYTNTVCTPTRTSLLTGVSAARSHITNWTNVQANAPTDYKDDLLMAPDWNINGISPAHIAKAFHIEKPLPQLLKQAGYHTIHVGKAHWASLWNTGQ